MQNHIRNEFAYSEGRLRDFLWANFSWNNTAKNSYQEPRNLWTVLPCFCVWLALGAGDAIHETRGIKNLSQCLCFPAFCFFWGGFPVVSWCLCRAVLLVYPPRPGLQKKGNQAKQRQGALKSKTRTPNHSWLKPGGSMKSSPALFFCAALRVVFVLFLFFLFCFLCLCLSLQHKQEKEEQKEGEKITTTTTTNNNSNNNSY